MRSKRRGIVKEKGAKKTESDTLCSGTTTRGEEKRDKKYKALGTRTEVGLPTCSYREEIKAAN